MQPEITPEIENLVETLYQGGVYTSRTEVLGSALRLLQQRDHIIAEVRRGTMQLDSGNVTEFADADWDQFRSATLNLPPSQAA